MATLKNTSINDTGYLGLPSGTTAQRPGSPSAGYMRYNTSTNGVELYNGSAWVQWNVGLNVVTSDLVLYWDANNPSSYPGTGTTIYDISNSGTAYNGTFVNTISYTSDNGYKVLGTNGSNSYIYNSSLNLSSTNYTVMVGSRYTSIGGRLLNSHNNNWLLGHWNGNTNVHYASGWITSSSTGGDTNWRIYTATGNISGDSYSFYSNNGSPTTNSGGAAGPNGIAFGAYNGGISEFGAGYMSFVLIYNRILTSEEMTQNYNVFKDRFGL
jgi:hypothetical protein